MDSESARLQRTLLVAKVVWGALLSSPILLTLVAWIVLAGDSEAVPAKGFEDALVFLFLAIGAVCFVVALRIEGILSTAVSRGDQTSPYGSDQTKLGFYVVRLALMELLAILGFVLAVLKGSVVLMVPFFLLSLFGFAISYPGSNFAERLKG